MEINEIRKNLGSNHDDNELIVTQLHIDGNKMGIPIYVEGKKFAGNPNENSNDTKYVGKRLYSDENGGTELIDITKYDLPILPNSNLRSENDPTVIVRNGKTELFYGLYDTRSLSEEFIKKNGKTKI